MLTGGAAILARMRGGSAQASKAIAATGSAAAAPAAPRKVIFVFGSQTGTAHEISRNLHAEAVQRGMTAEVGQACL